MPIWRIKIALSCCQPVPVLHSWVFRVWRKAWVWTEVCYTPSSGFPTDKLATRHRSNLCEYRWRIWEVEVLRFFFASTWGWPSSWRPWTVFALNRTYPTWCFYCFPFLRLFTGRKPKLLGEPQCSKSSAAFERTHRMDITTQENCQSLITRILDLEGNQNFLCS